MVKRYFDVHSDTCDCNGWVSNSNKIEERERKDGVVATQIRISYVAAEPKELNCMAVLHLTGTAHKPSAAARQRPNVAKSGER